MHRSTKKASPMLETLFIIALLSMVYYIGQFIATLVKFMTLKKELRSCKYKSSLNQPQE